MHDAPDLAALLASVRQFIEDELVVTLEDPRQRFRARVAAYVLAIAEREVEAGEVDLREEARRLEELLGEGVVAAHGEATEATDRDLRAGLARANEDLARRLREGSVQAEPGTPLWAHLRRITVDRLRVSNPAFLARASEAAERGSQGT